MADVRIAPLGGGRGISLGAFRTELPGRVVEEFSLEGEAVTFRSTATGLRTRNCAGYRTRLVVDRPADPAAASGTVVVEWLNVTVGSDHAFDWVRLHRELHRGGHTWVGVTAQAAGVESTTGAFGRESPGLPATDPDRYAGLHHPGDDRSYDLFTQAALALRVRPEILLGGTPVQQVLATGHSQSAARLARYLVDLDHHTCVIDGYLLHGRGADAPDLSDPTPPLIDPGGEAVLLPADPRVPVLTLSTETDVVTLAHHRVRQPDTAHLAAWEVAGTAHVDTYLLRGAQDSGDLGEEALATLWTPSPQCFGQDLERPMNAGPHRFVAAAALRALDAWVRNGTHPGGVEPLTLHDGRQVTDDLGIARGGIRTPMVDAPVARHSGTGNAGPAVAYLCGVTDPLPPTPRDRPAAAVVDATRTALERAIDRGHLVAEDAAEVTALAHLALRQTENR